MSGLNKAMIIGNVGADPEMKFLPTGTPVTTFRVAVSRTYAGQDGQRKEETEWFSVVAWAKLAEICNQYLHKGSKAYVEGRLRTRSWEGSDGQKRYKTELVAEQVEFLDAKGERKGEETPDYDDDLPF